MSKLMKIVAAAALMLSLVTLAPTGAEARWVGHPGWHGPWGGWRGPGWGWRRPGWGWGPAFVAPGWGWGPGWGGPYWAAGPRCSWVPIRVWRRGRPVLRSVWRCW